MARRLKEEQPVYNSLHFKLDDQEKTKISAKFNEVDFLKNEVYQLQESLQGSYKRIKILNETINEQRDKIFQLEGRDQRDQLEFKF
jgi:predicted RNase H-like nuclease (RuvC/YqgF family)